VIVSQLHRSPACLLQARTLFVAKIISLSRFRGLNSNNDQKNCSYRRVGKRKFPGDHLLRAAGRWLQAAFHSKSFGSDSLLKTRQELSFTDEDLIRKFYVVDEVRVEKGSLMVQVPEAGKTNLVGMKVDFESKAAVPIRLSAKEKRSRAPRSKVCGKRTSVKSRWTRRSSKELSPRPTSSTPKRAKSSSRATTKSVRRN
jgi:hypothetical protein